MNARTQIPIMHKYYVNSFFGEGLGRERGRERRGITTFMKASTHVSFPYYTCKHTSNQFEYFDYQISYDHIFSFSRFVGMFYDDKPSQGM